MTLRGLDRRRATWLTSAIGVVVSCLTAGLFLTGCGRLVDGPSAPPAYRHATGAEDVLVSIDTAGGYVQLEVTFRNTAEFLLLGDGTAIGPGAVGESYPGPALLPTRSVTVSEDRIQELFRAADTAGLLDGEIDYGDPGWTDLPSTNVNITIDGRTFSQSAYGLGFDDDTSPELTDGQRAARLALRSFFASGPEVAADAESAEYLPSALVAHRVSLRDTSTVDPGFEEQPRPWPIATTPPPLPAMNFDSCFVVTGPDAQTLMDALADANELTTWVIGTQDPVRMAFRPLLPGDRGCPD